MAFDLGALVTRMVVEGRAEFERAVDAGGAALQRAAGKGDDFGRSLDRSSVLAVGFGQSVRNAGTELVGLSDKGRVAFTTVGTGLVGMGLAVGAFVGLAVAKYADYDEALSKAAAVTGSYGDELQKIRELTLKLGGETVFSATEAAQGVTELGKAGVSTADILGGALAGSLSLAAAGELQVADAAAITATTLNQFRLRGEQASHVSDLLAAGAGKAQGEVTDMAAALKQSGLVANQFGLSVEETTGTLAAFASAGLIGSDAGTSFRTMLLNLATPTQQQRDLMRQYNIEAYDQNGNFVSLATLADQLAKGPLKNATQAQRDFALGTIFGSDAIRAANVLYQEGAAGIEEWTGKVDDANYATELASKLQDNLKGDVEKLGGAFDTALIKVGSAADGVLRDLVQRATELVDGFSDLPPWMQQVVLVGAALVGGVLLLAGATLLVVPRLLDFRKALQTIRAEMPLTTAAVGRFTSFLMGPWGLAIAAATLGISLLQDYLKSLRASGDEVRSSLLGAKDATDIFATAGQGLAHYSTTFRDVATDLEDLDAVLQASADQYENWFTRVDTSHNGAFEALKSIGTELANLSDDNLPAAQHAFQLLADKTDGSRQRLWQLLSNMPAFRDKLIEVATANGDYSEAMSESEKQTVLLKYAQEDSAGAAQVQAESYLVAEQEADALKETLQQLFDQMNAQNEVGQDAISTNIAYQDALNDAREAVEQARAGVEGYGLTLDVTTEAGRRNQGILVDIADSGWKAAEAQLALDGNTEAFQQRLQNTRDDLVQRAIDFGATRDEAEALADQILKIPTKREIQILADTSAAQRALANFQSLLSRVGVTGVIQLGFNPTGPLPTYANGGFRTAADGDYAPRLSQQPAMMLSAGRAIVWREDETQGETFIPHALSKRGPAEMYLARTAALFGGVYIPAGARGFADGDFRAALEESDPRRPSAEFNLGGVHFHNPVVRDIVADSREAVSTIKAELGV